MAELVVKSQCKSIVRQATDTMLNITFPIWGIVSPVASLLLLVGGVSKFLYGEQVKSIEMFCYFTMCFCLSLACLLLKRTLSADYFVVDKQGIKLPRLMGCTFNFATYIPWQHIESIKCSVADNNLNRSFLSIYRKHGRPLRLSLGNMDAQFIEQFLLGTRMWAPAVCDSTLDSLQNVLRISMRSESSSSYTDLWEEELGRRFCPTAYIALEPGKVLRNNTVKVISHLASGGLSALYLCQLEGKRLAVLKESVIPDNSVESVKAKARELFERESGLLMAVDHPGIVHILDCFSEGGRDYMVLEHINGVDLRQLVRQNGPQREGDVLEWGIQIANALKHLHDRETPIIHRDLTPDNIILRNDGQIVIVDFGAANQYIGNATGTFVGKHSFIAPEQLRGKATVQSDIYAFGCTLFFLLAGKEPEALSPSNPREHVPAVSEEVAELVESCTQLEAADRYQNVSQLLPVLRRIAAQSMVV